MPPAPVPLRPALADRKRTFSFNPVCPIRASAQNEGSFYLYDRGMPKVTQQYRDARRDQILSAARRCFLRDGFHSTSMQDLFAEAGLSAGAVYRYFASKDEVIVAIAEDNMREVLTLVHRSVTAEPDRPVGEVMAEVLTLVRAKDAADGMGGLAVLVGAEALRNPVLAGRLRDLLTGMHDDFTRLVAGNQAAGRLPAQPPAGTLARARVGMR